MTQGLNFCYVIYSKTKDVICVFFHVQKPKKTFQSSDIAGAGGIGYLF